MKRHHITALILLLLAALICHFACRDFLNMHWEESGAYTGEISPTMLMDFGVSYVINERHFNELVYFYQI